MSLVLAMAMYVTTQSSLRPELQNYVQARIGEFDSIPADRKQQLAKVADEVEKSWVIDKGPKVQYDFMAKEELWDPHVKTQTAEQAYEDVLANVGCNVPMLDDPARVVASILEVTTPVDALAHGVAA